MTTMIDIIVLAAFVAGAIWWEVLKPRTPPPERLDEEEIEEHSQPLGNVYVLHPDDHNGSRKA